MPFGISAGTALAIGAGVSAAAGLAGSVIQAGAAKDASGKAIDATERGAAQARADLDPWRTAGVDASRATGNAAGLYGQEGYDAALAGFHTSPGYQFAFDEGLRALDAGAAAKGMVRSGATLKAEQKFGTGLADQAFGEYYNRLFKLSELGQASAAGSAKVSTDAATSTAQTNLSEGSALSSIYGNTAQGLGNTVNTYLNNSLYADRTNALMSGYGGPGGGFVVDRIQGT